MWFLQHESLFEGKRVWLRPGSQQLFGRTAKNGMGEDGKNIVISHKAVSRQHMMIKVQDVPPEDGTKLHSRSRIEVTDLSCRQGTIIDNDRRLLSKKGDGTTTEYDTITLTGTEHTIQLVTSYPPFKIKWEPLVFTFAAKSKDNGLRIAQLHALDIKTSMEFVYGQTTHVVSQKRNLPKVLQGLLAGSHIVTSDFLDAILSVAVPQNTEPDMFQASKLEEDFNQAWPREKEYVPPVGAEPIPRDGRLLEPDKARSELFTGLTFIFLDEVQHSSLHEPLAGGGGKVLLYDIQPGRTTVAEYVEYVNSVMNRKRNAKVSNGRLPVITIRLPKFPEGMEDWALNFVNGVDQTLRQRSILQNEFLDAIIMKDAASLQNPPPQADTEMDEPAANHVLPTRRERSTRSQSRAPSQPPESQSVAPDEPAKVNPRKRPIRRGVTASRFTGFDDFEPPAKARKIEVDTQMAGVDEGRSGQRSAASPSQQVTLTQRSRGQSPPMQTIEETNKDQEMEDLFPAAATMKRTRAATRAVSASVDPEPRPAEKKKTKQQQIEELQAKARKHEKANAIDVLEVTRQRVKAENEKREADEEHLRAQLADVELGEISKLIQTEEMQVKPRQKANDRRATAPAGREWNPDWNGRKNFKKFKRQGAERGLQHDKVIVALEEAPQKKGFGAGDAFFLEEAEGEAESSRRAKERKRQQSTVDQSSESEQEPGYTRSKKSRSRQPEVINVEDSDSDEEEVVPGTYGSESKGRTSQRVPETQTRTQSSNTSRKRGAATVAAGPSKKTRYGRRDDDSDNEETGFRLKKRR